MECVLSDRAFIQGETRKDQLLRGFCCMTSDSTLSLVLPFLLRFCMNPFTSFLCPRGNSHPYPLISTPPTHPTTPLLSFTLTISFWSNPCSSLSFIFSHPTMVHPTAGIHPFDLPLPPPTPPYRHSYTPTPTRRASMILPSLSRNKSLKSLRDRRRSSGTLSTCSSPRKCIGDYYIGKVLGKGASGKVYSSFCMKKTCLY